MRTKIQLTAAQRATRVLGALAVCCLVIACIAGSPQDTQPRQGWWIGNGIVVPHDSFPTDCRLCHVEGGWNEIRDEFEFDHEAQTGYALEGAHARAKCLRCHNDRGPVRMFEQRGCWGCHQDIHRGNFGAECTSCHTTESWIVREQVIEHNRTRFPLVGSHASVQCWACHPGGEVGNWSRVDVNCITCHTDDLATATSPNHESNGWVQNCDQCHIPTTWTGAGFNHASFPLTGAHRTADCAACHAGDVFVGLPTDCFGCHADDFQGADDPDHVAGNFPTNCQLCHDTNDWDGAMFSHQGITSNCSTCHADDYQDADDPDHVAGGFPMACEMCHSTDDWDDATFSHARIRSGCATCHMDDYAAAQDPPHNAGGIPTTCEQCHATDGWDDAVFSHAGIAATCTLCHGDELTSGRPVMPDHVQAGINNNHCAQCHSVNTWSPVNMSHVGITSNCAVCHATDYNQTTDPSHSAAGFPMSCEACHSTNDWTPANFNHQFPITSGDHDRFDCSDCHTQPRSFNTFSCIHCHEHRQSEMDEEHDDDDVNGYSWNSMACYSCHPNGQD